MIMKFVKRNIYQPVYGLLEWVVLPLIAVDAVEPGTKLIMINKNFFLLKVQSSVSSNQLIKLLKTI